MSDYNNQSPWGAIPAPADVAVDQGLRRFMLGVYAKMALGLLLSGALAYLTSSVPQVRDNLFVIDGVGRLRGYTGIGAIVAFAPIVILLASNFMMRNVSARSAGILYWTIVALVGASLGSVGLLYTGTSIASMFLVTAIAFGGLSITGYMTKRNLSGMLSFAIMGSWGLLAALLLNAFVFHSGLMLLILSVVGVLIFAGLIAAQTQNLKLTYYQAAGDKNAMGVLTNMGALNLYLAFINLFRFLLIIFGGRR
jgi:FtsH-binding integral membrane protein